MKRLRRALIDFVAMLFVATLLAFLLSVVTRGCNAQPDPKHPPKYERIV